MGERRRPVVFVSSTCYDLKQVREDIKDFFENNYGFETMLSEFNSFPIEPCEGTFENCLNNVEQYADIFVLIIGSRYGYVTEKGKSITNLEYLHAKAKGIPIFVFVSKEVYNTLPLWRANKDGDFSSVVEDDKIFEFVADIYDSLHQWVYTFESARDISMTMKNQLGLLFSDGLKYRKIATNSKTSILNADIPLEAKRMVIEQPYAWEYKFLAYVLKNEFENLQKKKWDFEYGIFDGHTVMLDKLELINDLSQRISDMEKQLNILGIIINDILKEAMGKPGEASDLEMIIYTAKRFASMYERMVTWSLYFKTINIDDSCNRLLELLYELPKTSLKQIDEFVEDLYCQITSLPDKDDGADRKIDLNCKLDGFDSDELINELNVVAAKIIQDQKSNLL